jgi:hypothetical protein
MPWTLANEKALADGGEEFSVNLDGEVWIQKPQKYHARSLTMLRSKYAGASDKATLDVVLENAACLKALRA